MELRKHQEQLSALAGDAARSGIKSTVVARITPGGGKTLGAAAWANTLLDADAADCVLYVAPRVSLKRQVADGFHCKALGLMARLVEATSRVGGRILGSQRGIDGTTIRGFVTTYQDIAANPDAWLRFVKRHRVALVGDEIHHVAEHPAKESADQPAFARTLRPLIEAAAHVLLMSGTMERHDDKERISFIQYDEYGMPRFDVDYGRVEALRAGDIMPAVFYIKDSDVEYEQNGRPVAGKLSSMSGKKARKGVRTALKTGSFLEQTVQSFVQDFLELRRGVYSRAKGIVVCADQSAARETATLIRSMNNAEVRLAISDEPKSHEAIHLFRTREEDRFLVTVGMAYEGLDVPEATHMLYLSSVRSVPYFSQVVARAVRKRPQPPTNWPVDARFARVYVTADREMRSIIDSIIADQVAAAGDAYERALTKAKAQVPIGSKWKPIGSEAAGQIVQQEQRVFSRAEQSAIERAIAEFPDAKHWSPERQLRLATMIGAAA